MSKIIFLVAFFATSFAFANAQVECATSDGKIVFEGSESIATSLSDLKYKYTGEFRIDNPRSDRHYVIGDLARITPVTEEGCFVAKASLLVVDGTACGNSQNAHSCTLVRRLTTNVLCSYIQ